MVAVVVLLSVLALAGGQAHADPSFSLSQSTDLRDGQIIHALGTGLPAGDTVRLAMCGTQACRPYVAEGVVAADGTFDVPFVAHAVLYGIHAGTSVPQAESCAPGTCTVGVLWGSGSLPIGSPLSFDPSAPLVPRVAQVLPRTGLRDGSEVEVRVGPGVFDLGQDLTLAQCDLPLASFRYTPCVNAAAGGLASTVDGSFVGTFVVHDPPIADGPSCADHPCAVAVGGTYDLLGEQITFAADLPTSTTAAPSTTARRATPTGAVAVAVATNPRFTG